MALVHKGSQWLNCVLTSVVIARPAKHIRVTGQAPSRAALLPPVFGTSALYSALTAPLFLLRDNSSFRNTKITLWEQRKRPGLNASLSLCFNQTRLTLVSLQMNGNTLKQDRLFPQTGINRCVHWFCFSKNPLETDIIHDFHCWWRFC